MSEIIPVSKQLNEHVNWTVVDETGIIMLNNPPQNYLMAPAFVLPDILEKEILSAGVKGIIIKGKGRHFSAGASLDELRKFAVDSVCLQNEMIFGKDLLDYIDHLPIPVISAVSGACFGGGLEIALASHLIVCAETSLFAFPEVNYNLMPGLGGTVRLSRRINVPESMAMMLSGDVVDARTALALKLVDRVVPANEVFDHALGMMHKMISGRSMKVINYIVKAIKNSQDMSFQQAMKEETRMFCDLAADEIFRNKNL
ncbi:MAG: enoyl-CoA hydratase/isomerase family protein [Bacteroidota bacterium]